jgi:hypothetical protein
MKKLTKKQSAIIENLNPRCEDCHHYRAHKAKMMCHYMTPFLATKETQRLASTAGNRMNCGTEGRNFAPNIPTMEPEKVKQEVML